MQRAGGDDVTIGADFIWVAATVLSRSILICPLLLAILAGCATPTPALVPAPVVVETPVPIAAPVVSSTLPSPSFPTAVTTQPATPASIAEPPKSPDIPVPAWADAKLGRQLLNRTLPNGIQDRSGWANDIFGAFEALRIPYTAEYFCAANAVIEQESTWQSDPVVPGLGKMVWAQVEAKAHAKGIPLALVQTALLIKSKDGRSYKARIDALRTEAEMNAVFEEIMAESARFGLPFSMHNPIRTGGPMQVSVDFATSHAKAWPYPYPIKDSIRHEVFSRRGGLYFGIAILLHYRAPYADMLYRFADFNAGRYASRNAAFQAAIVKLSKKKIALDGDLLQYDGAVASSKPSNTATALHALANRLKLSVAEIDRDLLQEKAHAFDQTPLYKRVFELADAAAHQTLPRAVLPQIKLNSPKITRKLTTEWFAKRVDWRYTACLQRAK